MLHTPFFDPTKSYEENYEQGPFGVFRDGEVWKPIHKPQFSFFGMPVDLPFGIPAGPLLNGKYVQAALEKGFSIATYKTVRTHVYPCHQYPNVLAIQLKGDLTPDKTKAPIVAVSKYQEPLSITNSFGVPSKEADIWQQDLASVVDKTRVGQVVVGSFQGTLQGGNEAAFIADCVLAAKLVKETGVKVLEMNLSCPNEGTSHLLCFDIDRVERITSAVKNEIGSTPLIVKIAYFAEQSQLQDFVQRIGTIVDGISAINTIPATIVDPQGNQALPGKGRAVSGVCGDSIRWAGLEMTGRLKELRDQVQGKFTIIGVGGVMNTQHFHAYREAGADVVMSATGAMWNPYLAQEISQSIEKENA